MRFRPQVARREEVIEPDTIMCPCGCGEMVRIGEDRSERLDYEPAKFTVIETVRPRYACNKCKGGGVLQSPAPASPVEGGLPTEALLAHVPIAKYGDHLPRYNRYMLNDVVSYPAAVRAAKAGTGSEWGYAEVHRLCDQAPDPLGGFDEVDVGSISSRTMATTSGQRNSSRMSTALRRAISSAVRNRSLGFIL